MTFPLAIAALLGLTVFATSFLAGIFGMAGGMILMAVLLVFMPVPQAMMLHGVTQMTSNLWRAVLWRAYVEWRIVLRYCAGLALALCCFAFIVYVPDRATVLIVLGLIPMLAMVVPERWAPKVDERGGAELAGFASTAIQLVSGVSGPLLDLFFVRTKLGRRQIVASKAVCQTVTHLTKLFYFAGLAQAGGSGGGLWLYAAAIVLAVAGTSASRFVLERLSDAQFRQWTRWIVFVLGAACLWQGLAMAAG